MLCIQYFSLYRSYLSQPSSLSLNSPPSLPPSLHHLRLSSSDGEHLIRFWFQEVTRISRSIWRCEPKPRKYQLRPSLLLPPHLPPPTSLGASASFTWPGLPWQDWTLPPPLPHLPPLRISTHLFGAASGNLNPILYVLAILTVACVAVTVACGGSDCGV